MKLSDFNYALPAHLIAQHPCADRASARLLVADREKHTIRHLSFRDIHAFFRQGDVLVLNNTRVFKARLRGRKPSGGKVELLLVKEMPDLTWETMVSHSRRLQPGTRIQINSTTFATIEYKNGPRCFISFNRPVQDVINEYGDVPLPHYIKRDTEPADATYYQTVYAKEQGSIAAPTAGLHFTDEIVAGLQVKHVVIEEITLHIGPGTFKPIRTENIAEHVMEPEMYEISAHAIASIKNARRVFAVGTSVCRALETYSLTGRAQGEAHTFIYPGFEFHTVDCLITNFHLPCSTPLLLVCAFADKEFILQAYREAIEHEYRFLSYGDGMLIL
jgi:S-adenosylmethionine:tRNA ribosyltransferase-isomerase